MDKACSSDRLILDQFDTQISFILVSVSLTSENLILSMEPCPADEHSSSEQFEHSLGELLSLQSSG